MAQGININSYYLFIWYKIAKNQAYEISLLICKIDEMAIFEGNYGKINIWWRQHATPSYKWGLINCIFLSSMIDNQHRFETILWGFSNRTEFIHSHQQWSLVWLSSRIDKLPGHVFEIIQEILAPIKKKKHSYKTDKLTVE